MSAVAVADPGCLPFLWVLLSVRVSCGYLLGVDPLCTHVNAQVYNYKRQRSGNSTSNVPVIFTACLNRQSSLEHKLTWMWCYYRRISYCNCFPCIRNTCIIINLLFERQEYKCVVNKFYWIDQCLIQVSNGSDDLFIACSLLDTFPEYKCSKRPANL